ncbi:hypothetical protein F5Y06DRAFT_267546 [Hypoxylon sp. FL0890]|nr:hypothetical protein F5Y06DRAFT_267546 [Hypoxylon sp. FL0890]
MVLALRHIVPFTVSVQLAWAPFNLSFPRRGIFYPWVYLPRCANRALRKLRSIRCPKSRNLGRERVDYLLWVIYPPAICKHQ